MRLDFEAILGLLFFVFFIVVPLVRGGKKAQQQPRPPGQQPGQPGQQPSSQAGQQTGQRPAVGGTVTSQTAPTPVGQPAPDSLMATIEEIRRRVKEAQEREEQARRGGASTQSTTTGQASGTLVSSAQPGSLVSAPARTLSGAPVQRGPSTTQQPSRPPPPALRQPPASFLGREGSVSPELRVERVQSVKPTVRPGREAAMTTEEKRKARAKLVLGAVPATIGPASLLATDRDSIMRGLIWHEVLSEPMVMRRRKRAS